MYGLTRGTMTLLGVAAAGILLWLASFEVDSNGEYWTQLALVAAAGLVMAVSQLAGGWTKWGWPRLSPTVFLLGFLPALVVGGLVLLHAQPDSGAWGAGFAGDLGIDGFAGDLSRVVPAIAFLIGLTFGLTFDTTGPRVDEDVDVVAEERRTAYPVGTRRMEDRTAADEPVTAERHVAHDEDVDRERERDVAYAGNGEAPRRRGFFRRS